MVKLMSSDTGDWLEEVAVLIPLCVCVTLSFFHVVFNWVSNYLSLHIHIHKDERLSLERASGQMRQT